MIAATYFDGRTARRHEVVVTVHPDGILIEGEGVARDVAWRDMVLSERSRHGPRVIAMAEGARCEIVDARAFNAELRRYRQVDGWVVRLQQDWSGVLAAVVIGIVAVGAAYAWGLPWLADRVSRVVPAGIVDEVSKHALASLDSLGMKPSRLPQARRDTLARKLRDLAPAGLARARLHFRTGGRLGANALALPSGDIVVTDELVALSDGDDGLVLGVLAHELGHVVYRHGLRNALQSSAIGVLASFYLGDTSTALSAITTVGLTMNYSRGFEEEADDYGAGLLREKGMSPSLLVAMLERLEKDKRADKPANKSMFDILGNSHPDTSDRVRRLLANEGVRN